MGIKKQKLKKKYWDFVFFDKFIQTDKVWHLSLQPCTFQIMIETNFSISEVNYIFCNEGAWMFFICIGYFVISYSVQV